MKVKNRKVVATVMAAAMTVMSLAGCGAQQTSSEPKTEAATTVEESKTQETVAEATTTVEETTQTATAGDDGSIREALTSLEVAEPVSYTHLTLPTMAVV